MTEEQQMLSCREVVELLSMLLDCDLTPEDARRVREHILACPWCFNYEKQLNLLREFFQKHENELFADATLPDSARERIRDLLKKSPNS